MSKTGKTTTRTTKAAPRTRALVAQRARVQSPAKTRLGAVMRHVTDLGVLDRYLRGIDDENIGGGPRVGSPYKELPVIFRGINVAASALARVPFEIWDSRTDEPVLENQDGPAGELVRLFQQPHPAMTWRKFVETIIIHYHYGQAYLWPRGHNLYGVPSKILPLPPSHVRPLRDAGEDIYELEFFEYRRNSGRILKIPVDELLRLEYAANPDDPFVGISPFTPGRVQLDSDFLASVYQRSTMMNGGSPGGILSFDGDEDELPRAEADKLEGEWQRKFGAASSNSKVAILTGKWNYQVLGFRPRDMEFLQLRKYSVEEAARLLNVPQVYLSSWENVGLSDAGLKSQERLLYTINTIPLAAKFAEILNHGIIKRVDPNLEAIFNFDTIEALREDMGLKAQTAHSFLNMGFTLAQVNDRFDLGFDTENMNWANESMIGNGLMPARIVVDEALKSTISPADASLDPSSVEAPSLSTALNGAQIQSIVGIVTQVAGGALPRDSAVGILVALFGLTADQANALLGTAGQAPPPAPEQGMPAPEGAPAPEMPAPDAAPSLRPEDNNESETRPSEDMAPVPVQEATVPGEEESPLTPQSAPKIEVGKRAVESAKQRKISKRLMVRAQRQFIKAHKMSENQLYAKLRSVLMQYRSGVLRRLVKLQAKRTNRSIDGVAGLVLRGRGDDEILNLDLEDITDLMDEIEDGAMIDVLRDSTRRAFEAGVRSSEEIMEAIGVPIEDLTEFQRDRLPQIVDQYLDVRLGSALPTRVNDQIRAGVNEVVVDRIERGGSLRDAVQGIKDVFRASLSRARTIARTETQIAMAASRFAQYEEEGVDEHVWVTAGDEFVRDSHKALDGEIRYVGDEFLPNLTRPGDPNAEPSEIINCRCQAVAMSRSLQKKFKRKGQRMFGPGGVALRAAGTDFPVKGEDQKVTLRNSQFPQFDYDYAVDLKDNHPDIWNAGGNIRGDEAFQHWTKVRDNDGEPDTEAQEDWVREREAWMARHEGDGSQFSDSSLSPTLSNVAGIVAVIKWGGICTIGMGRMKRALNELKRKQSRSVRGFCPTGEGGGIDNSCSSSKGEGGDAQGDAPEGTSDRLGNPVRWDPTRRTPPVKVDNIEDAYREIAKGSYVEVDDKRDVYTLVSKFNDYAEEVKASTGKAPNLDLCKVSVPGTNLFCGASIATEKYPNGVPRMEMPQLSGIPQAGSKADKLPRFDAEGNVDVSGALIEKLSKAGIKTVEKEVPASSLKASQHQLKAATVSFFTSPKGKKILNEPTATIFVSRDGYVIDGHHRWAGKVAMDLQDGKIGDVPIRVKQIDMPIMEVLDAALDHAEDMGIKSKAA